MTDVTTAGNQERSFSLPTWLSRQVARMFRGLIGGISRFVRRTAQTMIGSVIDHSKQAFRDFIGRILG